MTLQEQCLKMAASITDEQRNLVSAHIRANKWNSDMATMGEQDYQQWITFMESIGVKIVHTEMTYCPVCQAERLFRAVNEDTMECHLCHAAIWRVAPEYAEIDLAYQQYLYEKDRFYRNQPGSLL